MVVQKQVIRIKPIAILHLGLFLFCLPKFISAQEANPTKEVLTIKTNPTSSVVQLSGEYQFVGRTPFVLPYPVFGEYKIKANKLGYETFHTEVTFGGDEGNIFTFRLKPKTPFKAFYRSLFFPGWGQYYSGRKFMGTMMLGATAGAIFALAHSDNRYQDAQNGYETALTRFNRQGSSYDEQQDAFKQLQSALQTLEDRENTRNTNLYIVGGVWLLNILESVLFFSQSFQQDPYFSKNIR